MTAALAESGFGVKTAAAELRNRGLAAISYQVLARIAAGEQKTCRQSVRDGLATLCDVPAWWLSNATRVYRPSGVLISRMERRPDLDTPDEHDVLIGSVTDAAAMPDPPRILIARWRLARDLQAAHLRDHPAIVAPDFGEPLRAVAWAGPSALPTLLGMSAPGDDADRPAGREDVERAALATLVAVRAALQPWIDGRTAVDATKVRRAIEWIHEHIPSPPVALLLGEPRA